MHGKVCEILDIFEQIAAIPRCSKHEEKISQWLQSWARDNGLPVRADEAGNVVIEVEASEGYENAPGVVVQGHMDMVCEKTPDSAHDFSKDPIRPIADGEWLRADKTTLGADNGIAIAMGLVLATDKAVSHPSLELLFTVDEEQGLTGVAKLAPDFIKGRILLNIDSEDEGVLTVGCSGGKETRISLPLSFTGLPEDYQIYRLTVSGLRGGHSGVDIHKHRASANRILARLLGLLKESDDIRLVWIKGGTAHNAIARDAEARIAFNSADNGAVGKKISDFEQIVRNEFAASEKLPSVEISAPQNGAGQSSHPVISAEDTARAINLMLALPHGVIGMSPDIEGLVETSTNFAIVEIKDDALKILSSQRSSVMSKLDELSQRIEALAALAGADTEAANAYPAWEPNMDSPLLEHCKNTYQKLYGKEPSVEIIHAGVECAILGAKYPGMDMISLGPTIENPHSPEERINIPTIGKVWDYLVEILKSFGP